MASLAFCRQKLFPTYPCSRRRVAVTFGSDARGRTATELERSTLCARDVADFDSEGWMGEIVREQ